MCDYFRKYSSNTQHVCREDRPVEGLCDHCQSDDLDLHLRLKKNASQTWLLFNFQYIGHYLSHYIQACLDGRLMGVILCSCLFQWPWPWCTVGRERQIFSVACSRQLSKTSALKRATTADHYVRDRDLDFAKYRLTFLFKINTYCVCLPVSLFSCLPLSDSLHALLYVYVCLFICLLTCLSVCLSADMSVCLPFCLRSYLYVCIPSCLSAYT